MKTVEVADRLYPKKTPRVVKKFGAKAQVSKESEGSGSSPHRSQATQLVGVASEAELFHTPDGQGYASFNANEHRETWGLRTKAFRQWLAAKFYASHKTAPGAQAVQDAVNVLEGKALYEGSEQPVSLRVAECNGLIYLDLSNDRWEAVEVTSDGWTIVSNPPVKFRRARGMSPLPHPRQGGSIEALRPFVNVAQDQDWILLIGWLVGALRPRGPYPVLTLNGEQGSAKSSLARLLRELIDPNTSPLRAAPRDVRDVMIAASNNWCLPFDNLSHVEPWLSDTFCRLSTGGGFATRELYSDSEETLFEAQRPIVLNGIEEVITRGDLLDRAVLLNLPAIPEQKRRPDTVIKTEFECARPSILAALLDAVVAALRALPNVHLVESPRMADFALWVTAAESGLNWDPGAFLRAYKGNRHEANEITLDSSSVAATVRSFTGRQSSWTGTATELLARLSEETDEAVKRQRSWPASPQGLSNALRRLAPNLRVVGIGVSFEREAGSRERRRVITLEQVRRSSSEVSEASENHG